MVFAFSIFARLDCILTDWFATQPMNFILWLLLKLQSLSLIDVSMLQKWFGLISVLTFSWKEKHNNTIKHFPISKNTKGHQLVICSQKIYIKAYLENVGIYHFLYSTLSIPFIFVDKILGAKNNCYESSYFSGEFSVIFGIFFINYKISCIPRFLWYSLEISPDDLSWMNVQF